MRHIPTLVRWILGLALLAAFCGAATAQGCPTAAVQAAAADRSLPALQAAASAMDAAGAACSPDQRAWAGRIVGLGYAMEAQAMLARGEQPGQALAVVDTGLRHGGPWPLLMLRGDLLQRVAAPGGRPDWAAASESYQLALNDINDTGGTPSAPADAIERLLRLAQQTSMLATQPVNAPPTRSGRPGGLWLTSVRGVVVTAVDQPIHFDFDSVRFTELGRRAVDVLADNLRAEGNPSILLVGHTDPVGTAAYNRPLSLRRAEAVRRSLVERGYPADRIAVEGRGFDDPVRIESAGVYTEAEIHQIQRRVALVRR